jgi:hypothetical protein
LGVRSSALPAPTTKVRRPILHSITDIMVAAAVGVMDMDKAECSISRILPVRHPECRESNS